MSQPYRDGYSKALIFVPSVEDTMLVESKKALDRELEEVRELKQQLQELLDKAKD